MIPLERRRTILHILEQSGVASIASLTEALRVSHMTVRRDIRSLEESGQVVSVPGGVSLPSRIALDASHEEKLALNFAQKKAIASLALNLIGECSVIYIDAGTTGLAVAQLLGSRSERRKRVILTNDLNIATGAGKVSENEVYLLGGRLDSRNLSLDGPATVDMLSGFNIDVSIVSSTSFDLRGISVSSKDKAILKKSIINNSSRSYLVADSSKYGRIAPYRAVPLEAFEAIVTDARLSGSAADQMRAHGVEVYVS